MLPVLRLENLTKVYKDKKVVNNVSFSLYPGEIYGFVGPNGAGKSTTLKMITGLIKPTSGSVRICGFSVEKNFKLAINNVGAMVENPQFYQYMSGLKNLKIFAGFYGKRAVKRIPEIVKLVGMENRIKDKVFSYSLGMKQRLGIAQALLNRPKLLILDEPTNGLDPNGIVEIRNVLRALAEAEKITILISSHNLSELEQLCDNIGIISNGKLIETKTMKDVDKFLEANQEIQFLCNYPNYAAMLIKNKYNIKCKVVENSVILPLKESNLAIVISYLTYKRIRIYGLKKIHKTLEELYFEILNKDRPSTSIV